VVLLDATTVNVADDPDDTETDDGCVVMLGALVEVLELLLSLELLSPPQPCSATSAQPVSATMPA
jgi:hypothetical protein